MNSNWTLRFPRTSREAFGYTLEFRRDPDRIVFFVVMVCAAFVAGLLLGGAV